MDALIFGLPRDSFARSGCLEAACFALSGLVATDSAEAGNLIVAPARLTTSLSAPASYIDRLASKR